MPRRSSSLIPSDLRSHLETARLDLSELDADCAEALWALDQPPGALDVEAMVRDTLASLSLLPAARDAVRSRLRSHPRVPRLEAAIRSKLFPEEAYNEIPGEDPQYC